MYIAVSSIEYPLHKMWMYHRKDNCTGELHDEFIAGVEQFDMFARSQNEYIANRVYRCLCTKRKNAKYLMPDDVKLHLYKKRICPRLLDLDKS